MCTRMMIRTSIVLALGLGASLAMARGSGGNGSGSGGRFGPGDAWWQSNSRWGQIHGDSANYPAYEKNTRNWDNRGDWPIGWSTGPQSRGPYWNQY